MSPSWPVSAPFLAALLLTSCGAGAQTANGSPTDPAPPGLVGTPRAVSRTAPSTRDRAVKSDPTPRRQAAAAAEATAAERAERRKLDHDLKICIGC